MNSKCHLFMVLDNLRSAYNVGSIFRTAEAYGVSKIYLTGYTPTPLNRKVTKTSLGAEKNLLWEHITYGLRCVKQLKNNKIRIVCLENGLKISQPIFSFKPIFPLAVVVGNELKGIRKSILKEADLVVHIPMYGKKESFNVAIAAGIFLFYIDFLKNKIISGKTD